MRRTPLNRVSKKRAAEGPQYERAQAAALYRDRFACQATTRGAPGECFGRIDTHHVHPVGEGGERLDPANLLSLCRSHHDYAHNNRAAAAALGLISRGGA